MNWLNIEIRTLRSDEYIGSSPVERATWLSVLGYSADQENGGRIVGAASFKDRQWQQLCGVTAREVKAASRLLQFEGDDLIVLFYPVEKEAEVQAKREAGRRGGVLSGEARTKHSFKQNGSIASSKVPSSASTEGKEKGKEGEREGEFPQPPAVAPDLITLDQAKAQSANVGIPADFLTFVYEDWHGRDGKDGAGVKCSFLPYVTKRWRREEADWKSGTHQSQRKGGKPLQTEAIRDQNKTGLTYTAEIPKL